MELSAQQLEQFDRDGFLVFPDPVFAQRSGGAAAAVARLSQVEAMRSCASTTGGVRTVFRVHETDGATRSRPSAPGPHAAALAAGAAGAEGRFGLRLSHQDQHQARDRGHGMAMAPGLRLVDARRLRAARHGDLQRDDDRHHRDGRRALSHPGQPQARPHRAGVGQIDLVQILGDARSSA